MRRFLMVVVLLVCRLFCSLSEAADVNQPAADGKTYAVVAAGIIKDVAQRASKDKVVADFRRFLLGPAGVEPNHLVVLTGPGSFVQDANGEATAEGLRSTLESFAGRLKQTDRFIFYYGGQANVVAARLRFNLPGEDIEAEQLAEWIKKVRAGDVLIVLDCPGAGLAVEALTGPGRVILCAARADQVYSTRFGEFFVPALSKKQCDTNEDGLVSVLEAFTWTCRQLDRLYSGQNLVETEIPLLEDDGDGVPSQQPWRYEKDGNDGLVASRLFLSLKKWRTEK